MIDINSEKAILLKIAIDAISSKNSPSYKVIDFVLQYDDYAVSKYDILTGIGQNVVQRVFIDLMRCGLLKASNTKGKLSDTLKKGRGNTQYYAVNKERLEKILQFIEDF